jgi:hypothetical protein
MEKTKKQLKEEKKNRKLVKDAFRCVDSEGNKTNDVRISKSLIHAIADSVNINKRLLQKDKRKLKEWQNTYYQELFSKFKELVMEHNKIYQVKADDLQYKIESKKRELRQLRNEIKKAEAEIELLKKND